MSKSFDEVRGRDLQEQHLLLQSWFLL